MKFGQALSILEGALPEEMAAPYREHLTKLQDSAPPMSTAVVHQQLVARVRRRLEAQHRRVRRRPGRRRVDRPGAPRPVGRRHRRRDQDPVPRRRAGADVRPAADHPAGQDLRRTAAGHRRPGAGRGAAGPGRRGARLPRSRPRRRRRSPTRSPTTRDFVVPRAGRARASGCIVTEWLPAVSSLAKVIEDGTPRGARPLGRRSTPASCSRARRAPGCCTPTRTPGNFRIVPGQDGAPDRLGVLDYGAVARLPEGQLPRSLGRLMQIALLDDYDEVVEHLRDRGVHQAAHPGARRATSRPTSGRSSTRRAPRRSGSPGTTCAASCSGCRTPRSRRPSWPSG